MEKGEAEFPTNDEIYIDLINIVDGGDDEENNEEERD
eukprot:CAMPEP_0201102280 /NCGR_PEP_ID=MMETSP0812-20130820/16786_1 /ASSEMBLY_ACC=CAM_ASM_000668 /TAXON_ID=98059 /ORGANISM="Dinobryon sp., Strain UTEXLB2267" /LENGTH=36 /DNA_ID= /DNA_START= /DNA_END= /DNA_ORIENTATION=